MLSTNAMPSSARCLPPRAREARTACMHCGMHLEDFEVRGDARRTGTAHPPLSSVAPAFHCRSVSASRARTYNAVVSTLHAAANGCTQKQRVSVLTVNKQTVTTGRKVQLVQCRHVGPECVLHLGRRPPWVMARHIHIIIRSRSSSCLTGA